MKKFKLAALVVATILLSAASCSPNPKFENPRNYVAADLNAAIGPDYKVTSERGCDQMQALDQTAILTDAASLEYIVGIAFDDVQTGNVVDIGDGFFEVGLDPEALVGSGITIEDRVRSAHADGQTAMLNLLYFFQPQGVFYPVDAFKASAENDAGHTPRILESDTNPGRVITIDTGYVDGEHASDLAFGPVAGLGPNYTNDVAPPDAVTGHGPAIADLIGRLIVDSDASELVNVHPVGAVNMGNGPTRTFTASALRQTLNQVSPAIAADEVVTINMSFGAKACEQFLRPEARVSQVQDVVHDWISDHPNVVVVAAAGNSGTNTRTYPAAWSDDPDIGGRVFAVGATGPNDNRSCYSDWGSWVDVSVEGDEVWVGHPTEGDGVWSGTSFAAPQISATVSTRGAQSIMSAPGVSTSPPGPNGNEQAQCVNL